MFLKLPIQFIGFFQFPSQCFLLSQQSLRLCNQITQHKEHPWELNKKKQHKIGGFCPQIQI